MRAGTPLAPCYPAGDSAGGDGLSDGLGHAAIEDAIVQIGPRRARRLLDGLGAGWAATIDADPERVFATLRGMGRRRAREAADAWRLLRVVAARPRI